MFINIYKKNPIDVDKCVQIEYACLYSVHVYHSMSHISVVYILVCTCTCLSIQNVCSICTHLSTSIGFNC
jgi:hypothetical protein